MFGRNPDLQVQTSLRAPPLKLGQHFVVGLYATICENMNGVRGYAYVKINCFPLASYIVQVSQPTYTISVYTYFVERALVPL